MITICVLVFLAGLALGCALTMVVLIIAAAAQHRIEAQYGDVDDADWWKKGRQEGESDR